MALTIPQHRDDSVPIGTRSSRPDASPPIPIASPRATPPRRYPMTSLDTRPTRAARPRPEPTSAALPTAPEFRSHDYDIAIVGLGYVGLPTALAYHHAGARVLGLEISPQRIASIRAGGADLLPSDQERLGAALDDDGFTISDDATLLSRASAVIVCVPTPVDHHLVPELSMLRAA